MKYLANLSTGRLILWCYFAWYLTVLFFYFDPNLSLWLTSLGLGLIVGFSLYTNARSSSKGVVALEKWQTIRFFLTPFCVSSFSALVKGQGFFLIFPSRTIELAACSGSCLAILLLVLLAKKLSHNHEQNITRNWPAESRSDNLSPWPKSISNPQSFWLVRPASGNAHPIRALKSLSPDVPMRESPAQLIRLLETKNLCARVKLPGARSCSTFSSYITQPLCAWLIYLVTAMPKFRKHCNKNGSSIYRNN